MQVQALFCMECGDKIYSRARHDFRSCTCGNISVDGGRDYLKVTFKTRDYLHTAVKLNVNEGVLFDDYVSGINKYGLIKSAVPYKPTRKCIKTYKGVKHGTNRRKA